MSLLRFLLLSFAGASTALIISPHVRAHVHRRSAGRAPAPAAVASMAKPTAVVDTAAVEGLRFMTEEQARAVAATHGTPAFVYSEAYLKQQARKALAFPNAYGLTVRFAMKACPNAAVLQTFMRLGLHIDASSGFEVRRAIAAGFAPDQISLSGQEVPADLGELLALGIRFNACSLRQLRRYGELRKGARGVQLGIRFNPGLGSGGTGKTNVGGPSSSFGIWHEQLPEVQRLLKEFDLEPARVHTHIGSGSDPAVWQRVAGLSLALCEKLPTVTALNLGGGYKVGRMLADKSTDLAVVGVPVKAAFEDFAARTGRKLALEVEPGTFLVANAGALVTSVHDVVTTGEAGQTFIKLNAGMTELLRPSLYGAQHPAILVPAAPEAKTSASIFESDAKRYVIVGHCCESGDLVTPAPDEPETLLARNLDKGVAVDDLLVIEGAGAYCSGMATKHYNSFPECPEVLLDEAGKLHLIRKKQAVQEIWSNEVPYTPKS